MDINDNYQAGYEAGEKHIRDFSFNLMVFDIFEEESKEIIRVSEKLYQKGFAQATIDVIQQRRKEGK